MIAAVTELNLKSYLAFVRFIPHAVRCKMRADKTPGLVKMDLSSAGLKRQRTLTVWESKDAMLEFVRSPEHIRAMKIFSKIASDSYTVHYEVMTPPSREEALEALRAHGKKY